MGSSSNSSQEQPLAILQKLAEHLSTLWCLLSLKWRHFPSQSNLAWYLLPALLPTSLPYSDLVYFQVYEAPLTEHHRSCFICITCICSCVHWSRLTDFTLDIWTPRFLWIPAHRIQMNTPIFQDAHRGPAKRLKHFTPSSQPVVALSNWETVPSELGLRCLHFHPDEKLELDTSRMFKGCLPIIILKASILLPPSSILRALCKTNNSKRRRE